MRQVLLSCTPVELKMNDIEACIQVYKHYILIIMKMKQWSDFEVELLLRSYCWQNREFLGLEYLDTVDLKNRK